MEWKFEYESTMNDVGRKYRKEFKEKGYTSPETIVKDITVEHVQGDIHKIGVHFQEDLHLLKWTVDLDEAKFSSSTSIATSKTLRGVDLVFVDADYRGDRIKKFVIYYNELLMIPETKLEEELLHVFTPLGLHKIAYGLEIITLKYNIEKHNNKEE